jgi:hypothetical protein
MAQPTLTQAAMALYDSIGTLPVLYNEELPEDAFPQLPCAYFLHGGEVPQGWQTGSTTPDQVEGSFTIAFFGNGIVTVEAFATTLMQTFTPGSLAIASSPDVECFRTNYTARGTKLRDQSGAQVHMASVDYGVRFVPAY